MSFPTEHAQPTVRHAVPARGVEHGRAVAVSTDSGALPSYAPRYRPHLGSPPGETEGPCLAAGPFGKT